MGNKMLSSVFRYGSQTQLKSIQTKQEPQKVQPRSEVSTPVRRIRTGQEMPHTPMPLRKLGKNDDRLLLGNIYTVIKCNEIYMESI